MTDIQGYRFRSINLPVKGRRRMAKRADRAGRRFGRLTVAEHLGLAIHGQRWWGCVCDCGAKVAVQTRDLDRGHTVSCGCWAAEILGYAPGHNKLAPGEASFRTYFSSYRRSAKYRHYPFELTSDAFRTLVLSPCAYCGAPPARAFLGGPKVNGSFVCNGVDRFENEVGYTTANSRPCCSQCNRAKGTMSGREWIAWLTRVSLFMAANKIRARDGLPLLIMRDIAA